jgi:hypothetical protein
VWLASGAGAAVLLAGAIVVVLVTRGGNKAGPASEKPSTAAEVPALPATGSGPVVAPPVVVEKALEAPPASAAVPAAVDAGTPLVGMAPRKPAKTLPGAPRKGADGAEKPLSTHGVLDQRR